MVRSVLSSLPQFLEFDYIRALVSVLLKTRLRMDYAGQTESRLHAHRESHLQTEMTNGTIVYFIMFISVKCHFTSRAFTYASLFCHV